MPEKIIVMRKWNNASVKVALDVGSVRVEVNEEDFTKRIAELMLEHYPECVPDRYKDLSWSFKRDTVAQIVKEVLEATLSSVAGKVIDQIIREMKTQVTQIV